MRVLIVHNHYQQRGGEDMVFRAEVDLLRSHGHEVRTWRVHNRLVDRLSRPAVAMNTLWSVTAARKITQRIERHRIELVHFHNTFPLLSPSVYGAARRAGAATVQTLHNYRLMCASGLLVREGQVCEKCVGKRVPWPAVAHRCYRGSAAGSAAVAAMLTVHGTIGTWRRQVDRYIALTDFARAKHIEAGLPESRIVVKPNFIAPGPEAGDGRGGYALYLGRLVPEKGIATLLEAWAGMDSPMPLKVVGDGPMADAVRQAAAARQAISYLPHQGHAQVMQLIGDATMLLLPSQWYEGFPRVLVEAMARGTPVVCSDIGSLAELVEHGCTGLRCRPGDADDLAMKVRQLMDDPTQLAAMRRASRERYEQRYTAERNYEQLLAIYGEAMASRTAEK